MTPDWEQVFADLDRMPDRQTINAASFKVLVAALGQVITEQAALLQTVAAAQREVTAAQTALARECRDLAVKIAQPRRSSRRRVPSTTLYPSTDDTEGNR